MKSFVFSVLVAGAALTAGITAGNAYSGGYGDGHRSYQTAQYGGGYGGSGGYGGNGGGYRQQCHWERQRVRIWDERRGTWVWVWKRVRICD
ncbi:MAG: hypothetical protein AB7F96_15135 [Beijerinckiaceae bacterium]